MAARQHSLDFRDHRIADHGAADRRGPTTSRGVERRRRELSPLWRAETAGRRLAREPLEAGRADMGCGGRSARPGSSRSSARRSIHRRRQPVHRRGDHRARTGSRHPGIQIGPARHRLERRAGGDRPHSAGQPDPISLPAGFARGRESAGVAQSTGGAFPRCRMAGPGCRECRTRHSALRRQGGAVPLPDRVDGAAGRRRRCRQCGPLVHGNAGPLDCDPEMPGRVAGPDLSNICAAGGRDGPGRRDHRARRRHCDAVACRSPARGTLAGDGPVRDLSDTAVDRRRLRPFGGGDLYALAPGSGGRSPGDGALPIRRRGFVGTAVARHPRRDRGAVRADRRAGGRDRGAARHGIRIYRRRHRRLRALPPRGERRRAGVAAIAAAASTSAAAGALEPPPTRRADDRRTPVARARADGPRRRRLVGA